MAKNKTIYATALIAVLALGLVVFAVDVRAPGPVCGDNICQGNEPNTCPQDCGGGGSGPGNTSLCQKMLIPAYFYPGPLWTQAIAAAPIVDTMIMNPSSGPGNSQNQDYVNVVQQAQAAGITIIGYVHTSYGTRSIAQVTGEIDKYKLWYNVDGIFLDEVSSSAADLAYYQQVADYIRATPGTNVVLNPGTIPDEAYISIGDTTIIFEDKYTYFPGWTPPSWVNNYNESKIMYLPHSASGTSNMLDGIQYAKDRNGGYVYVTDDGRRNPWDTLPTYWDAELAAINEDCL
jgi:hypothetical protein